MSTTTAPRPALTLTAAELADQGLRHRNVRSRYRELGFDTVAEAQSYADSLAAATNGEPVSPAFTAALQADAKYREAAAAKATADAASWAEQQKHVAAVERRDRAAKRLGTCRGNLAAYREQAVMPPDFGEPVEFVHGLGWAGTDMQSAHLIAHLEKIAIPQLAGELAAAQAALATLTKPPTTAKPSTGRN